ncbi:MAG TPA: sensor histidine kinase [Rhizomicrobium sp.]|nr:sensor histidine kinase [Rhizomicrobium sp.]
MPASRAPSLRFRLFLTVTLALLPIAIVSILQGIERARVDVANVRDRLVQTARIAASNEENILASSEQILRTLASTEDVREATDQCSHTLSDVLIGVHFLTNLARIDGNGTVICSALPQAKGLMANAALFHTLKSSMAFSVSGQIISPVTHNAIIAAMLPIRDKTGRFDGAITVGVNTQWLNHILKARNLPRGAVIAVFDRTGSIVAANNYDVARAVFHEMPEQQALRGGLESRPDAEGKSWIFAAAPLVGNNVFVGLAMRQSRLFAPTYLRVGTDFLLPIVMIGLAWVAIWFATDRQITQWINYLRRIAAAYRGGHYGTRPVLDEAPEEFRLLGAAMQEMADGIQDRDKRLRDAIAQKSALIRETHHRVKNNLQIVMSLLSLQANQLRDPGSREVLSQAQARIDALALVHRLLHEVEDQTTVDLRRLLGELTRKISESMISDEAHVTTDVESVSSQVPGEIAVPIALFTVEALMNIFKYAFPPERASGAVHVKLEQYDGACLRLAIEDDGVGYVAESTKQGIGSRLLSVFARQVHGEAVVRSAPGHGTTVALTFKDPESR